MILSIRNIKGHSYVSVKKTMAFFLLSLCGLCLFGCGTKEEEVTTEEITTEAPEPEEEEIGAICDLSTLEVYYHTVSKLEKTEEGVNLFGWKPLSTTSELWIEYYGDVKMGIDGSKATMSIDSDQNLVTISLPNPEVTSVTIDEDSYNDDSFYSNKEGWLPVQVTQDEINEAMGSAEDTMRAEAESDPVLLNATKERTEETITQYVENLNNMMGTSYKVQFEYPEQEETTAQGKDAE